MQRGLVNASLLSALALSALSPALSETDWINSTVGTYSGTIVVYPKTNGNPVQTKLWRNDKGLIVGSYSSEFQGQKYEGTLKLKKASTKPSAQFAWEDKYGSGDLKVKFSDDLSSFDGEYLSAGNSSPDGSWSGKKSQ